MGPARVTLASGVGVAWAFDPGHARIAGRLAGMASGDAPIMLRGGSAPAIAPTLDLAAGVAGPRGARLEGTLAIGRYEAGARTSAASLRFVLPLGH